MSQFRYNINMKNKFDSILKIKKNNLEKCEKEIAKINHNIATIKSKKKVYQLKINNFEYPSSGSSTDFQVYNSTIYGYRIELRTITEDLDVEEHRLINKQNEYKFHNIEFEKILYLKKEAEKLREQEEKKKEELINSDINSFMHYNKSVGV